MTCRVKCDRVSDTPWTCVPLSHTNDAIHDKDTLLCVSDSSAQCCGGMRVSRMHRLVGEAADGMVKSDAHCNSAILQ